jgi:GNAT superfamily N-acetyltransferase
MSVSEHAVPRETDVMVRPPTETDLPDADRIFRLAFGTFLGLPDPARTFGDAEYVRSRWSADPAATMGAEFDGDLVASNFATRWGSVAFFGPLTVRPDLWGTGIAKRLMNETVGLLDSWGVRLSELFTFSHSPKHIGLYHRYGFWPQHQTFVMTKPVGSAGRASSSWTVLSEVPPAERGAALSACRDITDALHDGLDVGREIEEAARQGLGDTVLVTDEDGLLAFAVCHTGGGSEAGSGATYVKFGAARPGPGAAERFERLLGACEEDAARRGSEVLVAGTNTGRAEAWDAMIRRGYRTEVPGVVMHRPNDPGYSLPGRYVIDDWR